MGSAGGQPLFFKINVRSPPPLHHRKCTTGSSVPRREFKSRLTRPITTAVNYSRWLLLFEEDSKPTQFSAAPRHSQFNYLYQDKDSLLGFKKKKQEDYNIVPGSHRPFKTAPPIANAQYKREEEQYGKVCDGSRQLFRDDDASTLDFVNSTRRRRGGKKSGKSTKGEEEEEERLDVKRTSRAEEDTGNTEGPYSVIGKGSSRRRRQIMKRSTMMAKQVISIQSALSLGFVSQLWVDTKLWAVLFVEVKPNLLSSELERFSLDDLVKVGDVVLVEDESVTENDFKLVGLETLVGYSVATPGGRNIGKVRGYSFDINSGVVESLEIDSFGISIIPSSLVSTYSLLVEDVAEVVADTVVVHEAAASRIQRLTKGLWGGEGQKMVESGDEEEELEEWHGGSRRRRRRRKKKKKRELLLLFGEDDDDDDEWELPMDYS